MDNITMTLADLAEERAEKANKNRERTKVINGLSSGLYLLCSNALTDVGFSNIEDFLGNEFRDYLAKTFEERATEGVCYSTSRKVDDLYVLRKTYDEVVAKNDEYGKALARGDSSVPVDLGNGQKARLNIEPLTQADEIALAKQKMEAS